MTASRVIGRPRSAKSRTAILAAAFEIPVARGYAGFAIETVAAGAGKTTVYRWWKTRAARAVDAFLYATTEELAVPDTGDARADFWAQIMQLGALLRHERGRALAVMLGGARTDPELARTLGERWLEPRRRWSFAQMMRAAADSALRDGVQPAAALACCTGRSTLPLVFGNDVPAAADIEAYLAIACHGVFQSSRSQLMTLSRRLKPFLLIMAAAAGVVSAATADPLLAVADLFGARLGMSRAAMLARVPGRCTGQKEGGPERMFAQCGARALSAGFDAAGRAWWVTASYDLTGTAYSLQAARAALEMRYGRAADLGDGALVWLPAGSKADARRCLAEAMLLTAALDLSASRANAAGLPVIDAGCLPIRSAILANRGDHHGVIVEWRDPRERVAELTR